jgi:hypothetical protein
LVSRTFAFGEKELGRIGTPQIMEYPAFFHDASSGPGRSMELHEPPSRNSMAKVGRQFIKVPSALTVSTCPGPA